MENKTDRKKTAMKFIILLGFISLFSDLTYEGSRSITGPYLKMLGATAATIGFVSGLGEFIGYALRLLTGFISDKTKKYWTLTIIGYVINLFAIPALAFAGQFGWVYAAALIVLERFGKAIRNPAKSTLTSFAAQEVGVGKGFAIQEALDQLGAVLGPVMLFLCLTFRNSGNKLSDYSFAFSMLVFPAIIALTLLLIGRKLYPTPQDFETKKTETTSKSLNKAYWFYLIAIGFIAAGFADFPLMAYHFVNKNIIPDNFVPILYAVAMGVDAAAALVFGKLYDSKGLTSLVISSAITAFFAPFAFMINSPIGAAIGVTLWGIGMGAQESILKSAIATIVPKEKRGTAYGIFNTGFGIFWFAGSWLMGILYGVSIPALVIFSIIMQLGAIPLLLLTKKNI